MTGEGGSPRIIVVGNEKGGAGKSTLAIHIACALLHDGKSVAVIDLDLRQSSVANFFDRRAAWAKASDATVPMPLRDIEDGRMLAPLPPEEAAKRLGGVIDAAAERADYVIVDTPGADTPVSREAHGRAELILTPMNDSFVDFDMLGVVDPVTLELTRPSLYAEAVWDSRKRRMMRERQSIDWLILRNRLATTEARNRRRLDERLQALSRRAGFRVGPGLRDRVIYRELFPFGLTVADLSPKVRPVPVALSHVAARQELRSVMAAMNIPGYAPAPVPEADDEPAEAADLAEAADVAEAADLAEAV